MASNVVGRRNLWVKKWTADATSKANTATWPFLGSKLFDDTPNDILI